MIVPHEASAGSALHGWSCVVSAGDDHTCGNVALVRELDAERALLALLAVGNGHGHARLAGQIGKIVTATMAGGGEPNDALVAAERVLRSGARRRAAPAFLFVAVVDRLTAAFRYASAAHLSAVLLQRDGMHRHLAVTGPPLGTLEAPAFGARRIAMHPGSCLIAFASAAPQARAVRSVWSALRSGIDPAVAIVEDARGVAHGGHDCSAAVVAMTPFPVSGPGVTYLGGGCAECDLVDQHIAAEPITA